MAGQDLFAFSRSFDFHQRGDSNFRWAATSFPIIPARVSAEEPHECWVARATLEALNASAVGPITSRSEGLNASAVGPLGVPAVLSSGQAEGANNSDLT